MPTAEQLLSGVSTETSSGETVTTPDKTLYIDFDTRQIIIPDSIHQLGVESDDDVKKLTFSVPRYYYGSDLWEFNIYINYMNAKKEGDLFEVKQDAITIDGDNMIFDWIVGRHAVAYKGNAIFNVCMKKVQRDENGEAVTDEEGNVIVEQEFNTTIAKLPVLEGLETGEEVAEQYVDILMQWEEALFGIENSAKRNIILKGSEVIDAVEAAGEEQRRLIVLKGDEVIETIDSEKTAIEDASTQAQTDINTVYSQALTDISSEKDAVTAEGEAQRTAIILKGSEVVEAVNTAGEEQRAAIILKGSEVINTVGEQLDIKIPEYIEANPDQFKGEKGDKGDPGKDGTSVTILGSYSTEAELIAAHPTGSAGDGYLVEGDLYVWNVSESTWQNVGTIQGPAGADGTDGADGQDGKDGKDGTDGVSPTVTIEKVGKVTTITITDANGTHTATINDGADGTGAGDMTMATYDTDGDGVVDNAANLGGVAASEYALKSDIQNLTITDDGNGNVTISIGGN